MSIKKALAAVMPHSGKEVVMGLLSIAVCGYVYQAVSTGIMSALEPATYRAVEEDANGDGLLDLIVEKVKSDGSLERAVSYAIQIGEYEAYLSMHPNKLQYCGLLKTDGQKAMKLCTS